MKEEELATRKKGGREKKEKSSKLACWPAIIPENSDRFGQIRSLSTLFFFFSPSLSALGCSASLSIILAMFRVLHNNNVRQEEEEASKGAESS